jgi:hypothetical protein
MYHEYSCRRLIRFQREDTLLTFCYLGSYKIYNPKSYIPLDATFYYSTNSSKGSKLQREVILMTFVILDITLGITNVPSNIFIYFRCQIDKTLDIWCSLEPCWVL